MNGQYLEQDLVTCTIIFFFALCRIGSGLLLRLLTYCSIFIPLENDCYLQITGTAEQYNFM